MSDDSTLVHLLDRAAAQPGAGLRFLLRDDDVVWLDWSELRERALRYCGGLQACGIARGDRVVLIFPTGPEFFDAFLAVLLAGAVPVPLYPPFRLGRLTEYHRRTARMIRLAGAELVLADSRVRRLLGETIQQAQPRLGCQALTGLAPRKPQPVQVDEDDLGLIQFSSGTTVDPKPVALSHRALVQQTRLLNGFWPNDTTTIHSGVSWLPLYHDMGLVGCVMPALERPANLTLIPPEQFIARPSVWLRAISRYRATVSPAPNFAYSLCVSRVRDDELEGVDLSSWQVALNGAETVVPSVMRAFAERFQRWGFRNEAMTPVYGMSEAALAVTFSMPDLPARVDRFNRDELADNHRAVVAADGREIVSVGRPLPGFELRITDDERRQLCDGSVGRIAIRGPSLMDGYFGQAEATQRALRDGWLDTGDLGFVHEGELFLTGRAKDLLILRGRNHAPEEVEQAVDPVPGVRTGCSVAVSWLPEEADGERLLLFVETRGKPDRAVREALPELCAQAVRVATGLSIDEVVVLEPGTLPRTSSGKLQRQTTLHQYLAGELTPPNRVTATRMVGAFARSSLAYLRWRRKSSP